MADIKAQLKDKNGNNLFPVTSMAYVTATFNGGLSFNSSTNTLSTYRIPIASVSALTTSLSAKQAKCSAGFRTEINGATVSQKRYFDIASNVSSGSLTLSAGQAYRIFATGNVVTLNAESFTTTQFGLEGHATILVTNNSYLTLGSNVVLGQPLANDAVNNCTLRFHDGHCIIDVEDHDAAHTVTVATGTGSGTLYYYCSAANTTTNETPQYISISDALDGGLVSFNGVAVNGEKHIVGNGTDRTSLTSSFTPSSKTYITHAAFSGMTALTGGTVYATDCQVVAGGTATFSSPLYAYEKLAVNGTLRVPVTFALGSGTVVSTVGNGGVINFGGSTRLFANGVTVEGVTLTNGSYGGLGGALYTQGTDVISNCIISGNIGSNGGAIYVDGHLFLTGCTVTNNSATAYGGGVFLRNISSATLTMSNTIVDGNIASGNSGATLNGANFWTGASVGQTVELLGGCTVGSIIGGAQTILAGSNRLTNVVNNFGTNSGTVIISSDAIIDLTGNTGNGGVVIKPGGGVTFEPGAATVYPSAGQVSAYTLGGTTVPQIGNTNVLNLSGTTATVTGGTLGGFSFISGTLDLQDAALVNGTTTTVGTGGALKIESVSGNGGTIDLGGINIVQSGGTAILHGLTITGGSGANGGVLYVYTGLDISGCVFSGNSVGSGGGAFYLRGGVVATMIDTTVTGNSARAGFGGGMVTGATISISNCLISGNLGGNGFEIMLTGGTMTLIGSTVGTVGARHASKTALLVLSGSNSLIKYTSRNATEGGSCTIASGAVISLTSSIAPGGGVTVLTGGCTVNGKAIAAGTYTSIGSNGTAS